MAAGDEFERGSVAMKKKGAGSGRNRISKACAILPGNLIDAPFVEFAPGGLASDRKSNRSFMSKWGFHLGEVTLSFVKP